MKLRTRFLVFLVTVLLLISASLLGGSLAFTHLLMGRYINDYVESSQKQIASSTESEINELVMVSLRLRNDQSVYGILNSAYGPEQKLALVQSFVASKLLKSDLDSIGGVCIVGLDGVSYAYQMGKAIPYPGAQFAGAVQQNRYFTCGDIVQDGDGQAYIPVGTPLRNFYTTQMQGALILYLRASYLNELCQPIIPDWGTSFFLEGSHYILTHPDKNKVGSTDDFQFPAVTPAGYAIVTESYHGVRSVVAVRSLGAWTKSIGMDWRIVSVLPYAKLLDVVGQTKITVILLVLSAVMLLAALVVSVFLSGRITTPLHRLKNRINAFASGKLDAFVGGRPNDELWELERSYDRMVERINELIERNNREMEKQREMELTALQAQINPHFLYNTLDAISWIARIQKQEDIAKLVVELSSFFRLSLHKGDKFITVGEEIRLVQSFVQIEQMLSPGKFAVTYDVPEEICDIPMLKITLQPIVENAIKHGMGKKRGPGTVRISGRREGDDIFLTVEDDGVGFTPRQAAAEGKDTFLRSGYGLKNVDERLRLEYGPASGVFIESKLGVGTRVTIRFQVRG